MSERDDRYAGNDLPRSTGEFRSAPDISASTAQFKAFAAGQLGGRQLNDSGSWPEQPWDGGATSGGSGRVVAIVAGVIVALAVIVTLILLFG